MDGNFKFGEGFPDRWRRRPISVEFYSAAANHMVIPSSDILHEIATQKLSRAVLLSLCRETSSDVQSAPMSHNTKDSA